MRGVSDVLVRVSELYRESGRGGSGGGNDVAPIPIPSSLSLFMLLS
jgi:hypothetical protein